MAKLLKRREAFAVTDAQLSAINCVAMLLGDVLQAKDLTSCVIPVSTMEWSSAVVSAEGHSVALVDVEQANALEFLFARECWLERPIFSYVEYMVRAAEASYDAGDVLLAFRLSERANARLRSYAEHFHSSPRLPRPAAIDDVLLEVLEGNLVVAFLAGHELAHTLQNRRHSHPLFDWVRETYQREALEAPADHWSVHRFLKPEMIQKFDERGVYAGDVTMSIKYATTHQDMEARQVREAQADAAGIVALSVAAADSGVSANAALRLIVIVLEELEKLMVLRRTLRRIPRGRKQAHIAQEPTNLLARQHLWLRLVRALMDGQLPLLRRVHEFWGSLDPNTVASLEHALASGLIEQFSHRPLILARGGLHMGYQGYLPAHPPDEHIRSWGPLLAGQLYLQRAHLKLPHKTFRIEQSHDWDPREDLDTNSIGFASAVRDIVDVAATLREPENVGYEAVQRDGTDARFVEVLRSTRSQVVARQVDPNWVDDFGHLRSAR